MRFSFLKNQSLINHILLPLLLVLHNIWTRYKRKNIYTFSGIVLVAVNPYQKLPIYEHNIIQTYAKKSIGVQLLLLLLFCHFFQIKKVNKT